MHLKKAHRRFSYRRAFTFLEVMVALAIISVALMTVIMTESQSMALIEKSRFVGLATELARSKMSELELDFQNKGFGELPEKDSGKFEGESFKDFRWSYTLQKIDLPTGNSGGGGEFGKEQGKVGMGMIIDAIAKSIRVLNLQISWGEGKSEQSYQLYNFFTNSKALPQFNLSGGGSSPSGGEAPPSPNGES